MEEVAGASWIIQPIAATSLVFAYFFPKLPVLFSLPKALQTTAFSRENCEIRRQALVIPLWVPLSPPSSLPP